MYPFLEKNPTNGVVNPESVYNNVPSKVMFVTEQVVYTTKLDELTH
jgi:hypothetical protein